MLFCDEDDELLVPAEEVEDEVDTGDEDEEEERDELEEELPFVRQVLLHESVSTLFPSSHCSVLTRIPSPQTDVQILGPGAVVPGDDETEDREVAED